jgi:septum formation protein
VSDSSTLILASASPRRHELLKQLQIEFLIAPADIDETISPGEIPLDYVTRMAKEKALAGFSQAGGKCATMGSDTIVILGDDVLGKPTSRAAACSMLGRLSGNTHQVYSSVALKLTNGDLLETINITSVTFGVMPLEWIRQYCQSDEPMDKAGAYAVQGGTAQYIQCIDGSYSGVMGLPLFETAVLLRQAGLLT